MSTAAGTLAEPNTRQCLGVWFKILRADGTIETALQIANRLAKTGFQLPAVWAGRAWCGAGCNE